MNHALIVNRRNSRTLANFARVAKTREQRQTGLLRGFCESDGLVIPNCRAIHTVGMPFPIDVLFLDKFGAVWMIEPDVQPGRQVFGLGATHTVELPQGTLETCPVALGDVLQISPA